MGDRHNSNEIAKFEKLLHGYKSFTLSGIRSRPKSTCLIKQIIDSARRVKFAQNLQKQEYNDKRKDPNFSHFDPLKSAIYLMQNGDIEEAIWLVFLSVHFGKNKSSGWSLLQSSYGRLGSRDYWTWENTSNSSKEFGYWLYQNSILLKNKGKFSNHRKYESLKTTQSGKTISTYVEWVLSYGSHKKLIDHLHDENPKKMFKNIYNDMKVYRFGRLAKFDFLCMIGKLGLVQIEPDSAYLKGATGPVQGARLLFGNSKKANFSVKELDLRLIDLNNHLKLNFGLQVLEDSLCNWQKSPKVYQHFRG